MKWNWKRLGAALALLVASAALVSAPIGRLGADNRTATRSDITDLKELKAQISFLNLVNSLNLTEAQVRELIELSRQSRDAINRALTQHGDLVAEAKGTLSEYRELLANNGEITRKVERNVGTLDHELNEAAEGIKLELAGIAKRMQAAFSEGQMQVIRDFAPCTIPPRNLKNPVRAGQAASGEPVMQGLTKTRLLDEEQFNSTASEKIDEKVRDLAEKVGGMLEEDIQAETQRILAIAREARTMTEEVFATNVSALADRVMNEGKLAALREKHKKLDGPMALTKRIAEYFMNEHALPILEQRLALTVSAKQAPPTDLEKIAPADACRDGKCALDKGK